MSAAHTKVVLAICGCRLKGLSTFTGPCKDGQKACSSSGRSSSSHIALGVNVARSKFMLGTEEERALISVRLDKGVGSCWDSAA